jgi:hypothetical protein
MIAGHIDDGLVQLLFREPFETASTDADVAGQDDYIGVGLGQVEVREFGMQITKNVEFHHRQAKPWSADHSTSQKSHCKRYRAERRIWDARYVGQERMRIRCGSTIKRPVLKLEDDLVTTLRGTRIAAKHRRSRGVRSGRKRNASSRAGNGMKISQVPRVLQTRDDAIGRNIRELAQYIIRGSAGGHVAEDQCRGDARSLDARLAMQDLGITLNTVVPVKVRCG